MKMFNRPPDQSQRELAVDPQRSVLVRAPAGSGKTGVLLLRYLRSLLTVDKPENVVAITFTNKAAGEIKERVLAALKTAVASEPDNGFDADIRDAVMAVLAHDAKHNWCLLENSARLRITTFDSFCGSLVKRLPLLSAMGAAAPVNDAEPLYREAILNLFRQLDDANCPPDLLAALHALLAYGSNRIESLLPLLSALLAKREQWSEDVLSGDIGAMEAALAEEVESLFTPVWLQLQKHDINELISAFIASSAVCEDHAWAAEFEQGEELGLADFDAIRNIASTMLKSKGAELYQAKSLRFTKFKVGQPGGDSAKAWLQAAEDSGAALDIGAALAILKNLPSPVFPGNSRELIAHFQVALRYLLAHLSIVFNERGGVDFSEIAQRAIVALKVESGEEVSDAMLLEDRVKHILVDEMQDTSYNQISLLEALCQGWEPGDGRSVFFCGDLQQSIYAFRGSLVSLFDELQRGGQFAGKSLEILQLQANFRSSPDLVNWVNSSFAQILATSDAAAEADYVAALAQRSNVGRVDVYPQVVDAGVDAKTTVARCEAEQVVDIIRDQQVADAGEGCLSSIAILVRSRRHLQYIVPALKAANIEFSGQDIDKLIETPAAIDFLALLRALWHEADDLAWAQLLRASFVGLSWQDLLCLRENKGLLRDAVMDAQGFDSLSADGERALTKLRDCVNALEAMPESRDLRWLLRSAWYDLGGPACIEPHQQQDINRLLALLDEFAPAGILQDVVAFERALERLYATPPACPVELMTIHRSKGLEFDVVILPSFGSKGRNNDRDLLVWQRLQGHMIFAPKPPRGDATAARLYDYMSGLQAASLDAELNRLIYVALTRAKSRLHILGQAKLNKDGDPQAAAQSFLARMWPSLSEHFERAEVITDSDPELPMRVPMAPRLGEQALQIQPYWQPPLQVSPLKRAQRQSENAVLEDNIEDRAMGIVFHELMERIGRNSKGREWLADRERLLSGVTQRLRHHCHPEPGLEDSVARVQALLENTLSCERGQWILDSYQWQGSEQTIRRLLGEQWQTLILDRVFIDGDRCWIVDYKTARARGGKAEFFAEQAERYRPKMHIYAQALAATGVDYPISTALYFPAHQQLLVLDE